MAINRSLLGALIVGLATRGPAIAIRDYPHNFIEPSFDGPRSPRKFRNGSVASGAAAAKRAARRRRNIAKHPRGAR